MDNPIDRLVAAAQQIAAAKLEKRARVALMFFQPGECRWVYHAREREPRLAVDFAGQQDDAQSIPPR